MKTTLILLALSASSHAAVLIAPSPPAFDESDFFNSVFDGRDKFYTDTPNLGQSFTTGSNVGGYTVNSISLQLESSTKLNADGTPKTQNLTFSVHLIDITTGSLLTTETGHSISGAVWATEDWMTISFDTPFSLDSNKQYGIGLEMTGAGSWQNGIPYVYKQSSDVFAGGSRYQFGDNDPTNISATAGEDLVFHMDINAQQIPEPSTALLAAAGLLLCFTRKRTE